MAGNEELTRDAALLVLNDHCGEEVDVYVHVDRNVPSGRLVMHAHGELRHWRDDPEAPEALATADADDMAGVYEVAGAHVDVTEFRVGWMLREGEAAAHAVAFELVHDEPGDVARDIAVPLVWLTVRWGGPEPEET